jgi:hypothetical protein
MPELLAALEAFLQKHRRCGELDSGVEDEVVWMSCECGASVIHRQREGDHVRHSLLAVGSVVVVSLCDRRRGQYKRWEGASCSRYGGLARRIRQP